MRSVDLLSGKEYNYIYENDRIIRSAEYDIAVNESEIVISKVLVNSIVYVYDMEDVLVKKRLIPVSGSEQIL